MTQTPKVDAHQHFWKVARGDYHWMTPEMGAPLRLDYMPYDMAPLLRRTGIDKTVLVQAAQTDAETEFLLQIAEETDFVAGVVGWVDMEAEDFGARLDALMKRPKFVGIRPMLQDHADDAYIVRPRVLENLRQVAERDLAFDFLTFPRHLPYVAEALAQVPGLRAVVDHISKPFIAEGRLDNWKDGISRIANHPNVFCKVSGMVTEADHAAWTPSDLAPYVEHVLGCFGAGRLMFGSDWPVCLLAGTYGDVLNAVRTVLDRHLSPDECDAVYGGNAIHFYRL